MPDTAQSLAASAPIGIVKRHATRSPVTEGPLTRWLLIIASVVLLGIFLLLPLGRPDEWRDK